MSPTKSTFSLGKFFGDTRHLCEKNEPTLDRFFLGGGVHGKVCWLIAYNGKAKKLVCAHFNIKYLISLSLVERTGLLGFVLLSNVIKQCVLV